LPEGSLQVTPVPLPPRAIELVRHDPKHDDVVPLGPAALLPQALSLISSSHFGGKVGESEGPHQLGKGFGELFTLGRV